MSRSKWVYAVRVGDLVKIGYATSIPDRFTGIRSLSGRQAMRLVAYAPGNRKEEQALHARFGHARRPQPWSSEVFDIPSDDDIVAAFAELPKLEPNPLTAHYMQRETVKWFAGVAAA